jgi:hypothetical protein
MENIIEPKKINFQEEIHASHNEYDINEVDLNEKAIFMLFFRRLSNSDFLTFFKLFALYSNCVISYLGSRKIKKIK